MRYGPSCSVKCCPYKPAVPEQYSCFWPKIFDQFEALLKRQYCMQTKNPRIHEFAIPKYSRKKYVRPCYCMKKSIEIERLDERQPTRTEQLALPRFRYFMNLKKSRFFKNFHQIRKDAIHRNMRKSHYSLYTYLSTNKQYCMKEKRRKGATKRQMRKIMARLEEIAEPVPPLEPPAPDRGESGEMSAKRLKFLSAPKVYPPGPDKEPWKLTPAMQRYVPTERILVMSAPKEAPPSLINPDWDKVSKSALRYRATQKIKEMAQPVIKPKEDGNVKENPFQISPNALKAVASRRVKELAEPKEYSDAHNKNDPFAISPKALRAVASPRIIELAKPKQYFS